MQVEDAVNNCKTCAYEANFILFVVRFPNVVLLTVLSVRLTSNWVSVTQIELNSLTTRYCDFEAARFFFGPMTSLYHLAHVISRQMIAPKRVHIK